MNDEAKRNLRAKTENGFEPHSEFLARMHMLRALHMEFVCAEEWPTILVNGVPRQYSDIMLEFDKNVWHGNAVLRTYALGTWIDGSGDFDEDFDSDAFDRDNDFREDLFDVRHGSGVSELTEQLDQIIMKGLQKKYRHANSSEGAPR